MVTQDITFMVYLVTLLKDSEDYGVYRFKRGFNVQIEELIGDFYKPINKVKYWLFTTLDRIRSKVKNKYLYLRAYWGRANMLFYIREGLENSNWLV